MKKILGISAIAVSCCILVGCSSSNKSETTTTTSVPETTTETTIVETTEEHTTAIETTASSYSSSDDTSYILNTHTHKFHYPGCSSVEKIKESNKDTYTGDRDYLISSGYSPCKKCNP